jgi:hypothetical protein
MGPVCRRRAVRSVAHVTSSPRARVDDACRRRSHAAVVAGCRTLLAGGTADPDLIITLGGPAASRYLDDGEPEQHSYWLRVWAARGLLWAGPAGSTAVLHDALGDEHWRVRAPPTATSSPTRTPRSLRGSGDGVQGRGPPSARRAPRSRRRAGGGSERACAHRRRSRRVGDRRRRSVTQRTSPPAESGVAGGSGDDPLGGERHRGASV